MEIQTSVFQMRNPLLLKLFKRYFFWTYWCIRIKIRTSYLTSCTENNGYNMVFGWNGDYDDLKILVNYINSWTFSIYNIL